MAITFYNVRGLSESSGDTLTISPIVSATNPVIVVCVAIKGNDTVQSMIRDSLSFTQLNTDINGDARSELWYLAGPSAGTLDIVITLTGSSRWLVAGLVYTGVHQTTPFRTAAANSNNGTNEFPTVDVVALNGEMVVDSLCQVSAGPDTAVADHTERRNAGATGGGTDTAGASQEKASSGAIETMGWTMSDSDNWAICAGPLQEAGAAPGRTTYNTDSHPLGQHLGHSLRMPGG